MIDLSLSNENRTVYVNVGADKRVRALIVYSDGHRVNVSYPRMLMEEKLGRPLAPNEDVHHKDGNTLNNNIENLEVLNLDEHRELHSKQNRLYHDKTAICEYCGNEFIWTAIKQRAWTQNTSRKKNAGKTRHIFCSKACAGAFGRKEQLGRNI